MSTRNDNDAQAQRSVGPQDVPNLGKALLTLAAELWIVRDRMMVLERVLDTQGLEVQALVDSHVPDAALQAKLDAERKRITAALMDALTDEGNTSGVFDR
jgi:hypothetical protein